MKSTVFSLRTLRHSRRPELGRIDAQAHRLRVSRLTLELNPFILLR